MSTTITTTTTTTAACPGNSLDAIDAGARELYIRSIRRRIERVCAAIDTREREREVGCFFRIRECVGGGGAGRRRLIGIRSSRARLNEFSANVYL